VNASSIVARPLCSAIIADLPCIQPPLEPLSLSTEEQGMKDMEQHLLKLRADAEECSNISKLATVPRKRDLFARLAQHLDVLAAEVARNFSEKYW
jgi:hypothetical protein